MVRLFHARYGWEGRRGRHAPTCREAGVITATDGITGFFEKIAELCNGSTYDSDSYCLGSNPSSAATKKTTSSEVVFDFLLHGVHPTETTKK